MEARGMVQHVSDLFVILYVEATKKTEKKENAIWLKQEIPGLQMSALSSVCYVTLGMTFNLWDSFALSVKRLVISFL